MADADEVPPLVVETRDRGEFPTPCVLVALRLDGDLDLACSCGASARVGVGIGPCRYQCSGCGYEVTWNVEQVAEVGKLRVIKGEPVGLTVSAAGPAEHLARLRPTAGFKVRRDGRDYAFELVEIEDRDEGRVLLTWRSENPSPPMRASLMMTAAEIEQASDGKVLAEVVLERVRVDMKDDRLMQSIGFRARRGKRPLEESG